VRGARTQYTNNETAVSTGFAATVAPPRRRARIDLEIRLAAANNIGQTLGGRAMRAGELMRTDVVTFHESDPIEEVLDVLVERHIHGAPVVDGSGRLIGVISQLDIHFGRMTRDGEAGPDRAGLTARDVMTSPPVSAGEETEVVDLCQLMYKLRIHRVPIVRGPRIVGVVSSLDVCQAIASGKLAQAG
jgi:CBS domain-containing protein